MVRAQQKFYAKLLKNASPVVFLQDTPEFFPSIFRRFRIRYIFKCKSKSVLY